MKKIIELGESEGLETLLGERVTLFCVNYIYTGKLVGVDSVQAKLEEAAIVYETGELHTPQWKDVQTLPHDWYVRLSAVESYGVLK